MAEKDRIEQANYNTQYSSTSQYDHASAAAMNAAGNRRAKYLTAKGSEDMLTTQLRPGGEPYDQYPPSITSNSMSDANMTVGAESASQGIAWVSVQNQQRLQQQRISIEQQELQEFEHIERNERRSREERQKNNQQAAATQQDSSRQQNILPSDPRVNRPSYRSTYGAIELGDIDGESDQVLLGSAFDDTRNVQAALNIASNTDTARRGQAAGLLQQNLAVVEENNEAKTQRVHEAWRRQKLLQHMQEDEEVEDGEDEEDINIGQRNTADFVAQDYPQHKRLANKRSIYGDSQVQLEAKEEIQQPTLSQVQKENSMSFGVMQQKFQNKRGDNVLNSEPEEDFYINSGRSHHKVDKASSLTSVSYAEVKATDFEDFSSFKQLPLNQPQQRVQQQQQLEDLQKSQRDRKNIPVGLSKDNIPSPFLTETPRALEQQNQNLISESPSPSDFLTSERQFQQYSNPNKISMQQHQQYSMQSVQPGAFPLVRMNQPQTDPKAPGAKVLQQPPLQQPPEQFLSLDHFLNEQSPPQFMAMPDLQAQMSSSRQQSTDLGQNLQQTMQVQGIGGFAGLGSMGSSASGQLRNTDTMAHQTNQQNRRIMMGQQQQRQQIVPSKSPRMASTSPLRVDPDEIKRRQLNRQHTLEQKRKQEIEDLRRQAIEKERIRKTKLRAVVMVQKWVRGHLCRLECARMRNNFRYIRKLRRLLSIAYGKKRSRFVKQLVLALKETGKKHQKKFEEEIGAFCATLIQKVWRGFHFRNVVKKRLIREQRSKRLLRGLILGYKTRCILFRTRECDNLKKEIQDVSIQLKHWQQKLRTLNPATTTKQQHQMMKMSRNQSYEERCTKVAQLIRTVAQLKKGGRWIYQLLPPPQQIPISTRQQQTKINQFDLFRGAPPIESNQKFAYGDETENEEHSLMLPTVINKQKRSVHQGNNDGINNELFTGDIMDEFGGHFGGGHDETARNLIATVNGGNISPMAIHHQNANRNNFTAARTNAHQQQEDIAQEENDDDAMPFMWPSQQQQKAPAKQEGVAHPDEEELESFWPSAKAKKQVPDDEEIAFMWPSQQTKNTKPATSLEALRNRIAEFEDDEHADNDDMMDNIMEDNDGGTMGMGAIVWPSAKAADKEERKGAAMQNASIVIESKWNQSSSQQKPHWEDQPIRTKNNTGDQNPFGIADSSDRLQQREQQQILVNQSQASHRGADESVSLNQQPPKVDFEAMIEKAMLEAGEQPPTSKRVNQKPKLASSGANTAETTQAQKDKEQANPGHKKKTEEAAALLEKRKRYDPRKALKKGKKALTKKVPAKPTKTEDVQNSDEQVEMVQEQPQIIQQKVEEVVVEKQNQIQEEKKKPIVKAQKHAFKGRGDQARDIDEIDEQAAASQQPALVEEQSTKQPSAVAPKPFLKRKTKTMQPAKINWKTKSRIDCWGGQAKVTAATKKEIISPPQKAPQPQKSLIEAQQELEQSMSKFAENKPGKTNLLLSNSQDQPTTPQEPVTEYELQQPQSQFDVLDTEYECETVPNESQADALRDQIEFDSVLPGQALEQQYNNQQLQIIRNASDLQDGLMGPGELHSKLVHTSNIIKPDSIPNAAALKRPRLPAVQATSMKSKMSPPTQLQTEVDEDFDQEPVPRPMVQQTMNKSQQFQAKNQGRRLQNPKQQQQQQLQQPQYAPQVLNSRVPTKPPPDIDTETQDYNTFSQPDFARPSQVPPLTMGQSYLVGDHQREQLVQPSHTDREIDISDIQAQISSVMTHQETSQVLSGFPMINQDNQMPAGQSNLQLEELQKVFDLFHTEIETVEEMVPQTSLQRMQERNFPRPLNGRQVPPQKTRTAERKRLKSHQFIDIQIEDVIGQDTCIPHLDVQQSVFFKGYSAEQFEEIFEDLKGHYKRLCDEEPQSVLDENDDIEINDDRFSQF